MFVVLLKYKAAITEVDKHLQAHRQFLDYYYKQGLLLVSGPMNPRTGGVIIALTKDKTHLESVIKQDPFYLAEIAEYQIIAFTPVKCCEELKALIEKI